MLFMADPFFAFEAVNILGYVLLLIGTGLVAVEIFLPGFGAPGIIGIIALVAGVFLATENFMQALVIIAVIMVILAVALFIALRSASKGRLSRSRLILHTAEARADGFAPAEDLSALAGVTGRSITTLRPAGTGEFGGKRYDVVTEGVFIDPDKPIRVLEVDGQRIVVELIEG